MKIVKYILVNLVVLIALLAIVDPLLISPRPETDRYIQLREPARNQDFTISLSEYLAGQSQGLEVHSEFRLRTDNHGFYIGENSLFPTEFADIIFFGGSTTECIYVDESNRFPYLVGEKLTKRSTGQKVVTLNGGLRGNNSMHSLMNFLSKGIPLKPKIVVFMHNVNDLSQLEKTGSYWNSPDSRSIIIRKDDQISFKNRLYELIRSMKNLLIPNLYHELNNLWIGYKKNRPGYMDEWQSLRRKESHVIDKVLIDFEKAIKSFVQVAKIHDVKVVLMTQFNRLNPEDDFSRSLYSSDFDQLCRNYSRFNQKIREISRDENVFLIDLANEIPGDSTFIYDFVHLNNHGSKLVAEIIAKELSTIAPNYEYVEDAK